uniref:Casein kinase substrate phosphoprotein PP28 domain-containing protein n=1 Tax=Noctiluca scintillans TaxID=2966 RepID=A0A7S1B1R2_NOCSC|mmetsp:Transcript_7643/g.20835  ORF Transcript_7643/g.20835 Transcript_7643/m.20835 type:complete len:224 (+) Transcript_7643:61-732(+)
MPAAKNKKNHYKHAGESKHISSIEEVMARNRADAPRPDRQAKKEESEDELPEAPEPAKPSRKGIESVNPNLQPRNEMKDGVELSRKQREELEKERARRHYEELHRQGKTPEAKADLARLEEVKKRREEAALKRKEDEEKAAAAEVSKAKGNTKSEFSEALGGDAVRMRGERSQAKKKEAAGKRDTVDLYSEYCGEGEKPKDAGTPAVKDGTIGSCRAIEDDFM